MVGETESGKGRGGGQIEAVEPVPEQYRGEEEEEDWIRKYPVDRYPASVMTDCFGIEA